MTDILSDSLYTRKLVVTTNKIQLPEILSLPIDLPNASHSPTADFYIFQFSYTDECVIVNVNQV